MKTCLFGGAFDPVHAGHLMIARVAMERCRPERMVWLPAACSPFKQAQSSLFTSQQRLEMLRAATRGMEHVEVSDMDLKLPAPSWTWRLVERWKEENPADELLWLLGLDEWNELHRWARFDFLVRELTFVVCRREGEKAVERPGVRAIFPECGEHPASSKELRRLLEQGRPIPTGWLSPDVQELVEKYLASRHK